MNAIIPGAREFDGARVAVMGMGKSGRASVAALLHHTDAALGVWDAQESAVAEYASEGRIARVFASDEAGELARDVVAWNPTHVVISPAFAEEGADWKVLSSGGITPISEIELAWKLRAAREDGSFAQWLAVTGTNGKTTTVTMLAAILAQAGLGDGVALGNIGNPAVTAVSDTSKEIPAAYAFELSSFQLASTYSMQAAAAACLNLADDHLEWHSSFDSYRRAKAKIYEGVQKACIYPVGDTQVQAMVDGADVVEGARAIGTTLGIPSVGMLGVAEGLVLDRAFTPKRQTEAMELFSLEDLLHLAPVGGSLPVHIVKDALAASALARSIGVAPEQIRLALSRYSTEHHRIEYVATVQGVRYVDDSKATNAHAALASVSAQREQSVVWIVGGQPKGARFDDLVDKVRSKIRAAVVIGVDQEAWQQAFAAERFPVIYVDPEVQDPMAAAVQWARKLAQADDTVLLAPATASMDQFKSYAARGDAFAREVRALDGGAGKQSEDTP